MVSKRIPAAQLSGVNPVNSTSIDSVVPAEDLMDNFNAENCLVTLSIPEDVKCSYVGKLLKIAHILSIELITPLGVTSPEVRFDIFIHGDGNMFKFATATLVEPLPTALNVTISTENGNNTLPSELERLERTRSELIGNYDEVHTRMLRTIFLIFGYL